MRSFTIKSPEQQSLLAVHRARDLLIPDTPQGKICIIEERGSGYVGAGFKETLQQFAERFGLTPRERDIVELALRGYPNTLIAKELDISPGTVRNHRYRLYFKLDITTEREFFTLFLDEITGGGESRPA